MRQYEQVWCPDCGCLMKRRTGKFGNFWGCSAFPHCTNTMSERDAANQADPPNTDCAYLDEYLEPPDGS